MTVASEGPPTHLPPIHHSLGLNYSTLDRVLAHPVAHRMGERTDTSTGRSRRRISPKHPGELRMSDPSSLMWLATCVLTVESSFEPPETRKLCEHPARSAVDPAGLTAQHLKAHQGPRRDKSQDHRMSPSQTVRLDYGQSIRPWTPDKSAERAHRTTDHAPGGARPIGISLRWWTLARCWLGRSLVLSVAAQSAPCARALHRPAQLVERLPEPVGEVVQLTDGGVSSARSSTASRRGA